MKSIRILALLALTAFVQAATLPPADYTVAAKNKNFSVTKLTVKVGDTVHFKNEDPFSHNIFSLSEIATFDLGSYPQGQSRPHTFDKPGKADVECALHPNMRLEVEVKP